MTAPMALTRAGAENASAAAPGSPEALPGILWLNHMTRRGFSCTAMLRKEFGYGILFISATSVLLVRRRRFSGLFCGFNR